MADATKDFEELLGSLKRHEVRFVVVGPHAVAYHAKPRYTKDFDLLVAPDVLNGELGDSATWSDPPPLYSISAYAAFTRSTKAVHFDPGFASFRSRLGQFFFVHRKCGTIRSKSGSAWSVS